MEQTGSYLAQLGLQLAMVVGAIVVCGWLIKRMGKSRVGVGGDIRVTAMRSLGGKERLLIVEVEGRRLLIGASPGGLSTLHALKPVPPESGAVAQEAALSIASRGAQ